MAPAGPEGQAQQLVVVDKDAAGRVRSRVEMGVVYVPLTSEQAQRSKAAARASALIGGPQGSTSGSL